MKNSSRNGWEIIKFGDVADNIAQRINPAEAETDVYVGLEHLDPSTIHLRKWGQPSDVTGQKLLFKKGDVIFGRRRAYQRKLALADCDGICSAHAMVVRAKPDRLLPEFLPFFLQSDMFMERAIEISVGSLSPTINWKTLRVQEFPIPSISEQKRIAEVLWTADDAVVAHERALLSLDDFSDAFTSDFFSQGWPRKPLGDLLTSVKYGSSKRILKKDSGLVPILRIPNVIGGGIDLSDLGWVKLSEKEVENYRLENGDVLIVRTNGNPDYVGRTAVVRSIPTDCVYASYLIRLKSDTSVLRPTYLHASLSSSVLRRTLRHEIRSSAGNYNLNSNGIKRQRIPLPPMNKQEHFVARFNMFQDKRNVLQNHISALAEVRQSLVNREIGACNV